MEFVKIIINNKTCFLNKDTSEITQIFGTDWKLGRNKNKQNALYYFGSFDHKTGLYLIFGFGKDYGVEDVDTLYIDLKTNNIINKPKTLSSVCDSIKLKLVDNWKYSNNRYTSNANFIKGIVKSKDCLVGKDSTEIVNIFGVIHTLMRYKKVQDALYYDVTFDRESGASLLFVLDEYGRLEDIDPIYIESGYPVK